ncbi:ABC transporter ATP-binding protein [Lachnospiraceae bacterium C1.1]|nr:ABC transporter ATP-binding protein [Lachnospiraceae bacterium C1.1]
MAYIELKKVNKFFDNNGEDFQVLRDIDLEIEKGEFICFVGASGCGKSTLLRSIAGLEVNYQGSITVDGKEIKKPEKQRGMVFQEPRLFPWMNVGQNIGYVLDIKDKEAKRKKVEEFVNMVGLKGFENSLPKELSGGMAQRAGIARALANEPEVLLMDEPFGALDALTKIQLQQTVRKIHNESHQTTIMVTHDIEEAVFLADRIVIFTNRPGSIRRIINVDLPADRDRNSIEFVNVRKKVFDSITISL